MHAPRAKGIAVRLTDSRVFNLAQEGIQSFAHHLVIYRPVKIERCKSGKQIFGKFLQYELRGAIWRVGKVAALLLGELMQAISREPFSAVAGALCTRKPPRIMRAIPAERR